MPDTSEATGTQTVAQQSPPLHLLGDSTAGAGGGPLPPAPAGTERYELLEEIARGGMGVVYRARDRVLDREVGVKTLLTLPHEGTVAAARFREEAIISGQLQHPNVPPVHDLGTLPDGRPFIAMKLIKGQTLDALLKARPDPSHDRGRFLAAFEKVAEGVAYAHDHCVVHRDLKPLNVMAGDHGEVQVMDWGLAKVLGGAPAEAAAPAPGSGPGPSTLIRPGRDGIDETRPGSVFGTPAYMPREQAIGAVDLIDARSDVFSLGAVLCAILTGKPPYAGGDAESTRQLAAAAKLDDAFARLDSCGAGPELIALCKRCLAAGREARPRDAGEVARAVADFRAEAERRAREAELDRVRAEGERAKAELQAAEQRKRRKVQLALAAAALLLVAGSGAAALWKRAADERHRLEEEQAKLKESRLETGLAQQETARVRAEADARDRQAQLRSRLDRNRAALLPALDRCERALRAGDSHTASLAMAEVGERSRESGTEELAPRAERCRTDLAMLNELDRIDEDNLIDNRWVEGKGPREPDTVRWENAFARYGVTRTMAPAAAQRIGDSLIRERLLTSLEMWFVDGRDASLGRILAAADPDAFRNEARATSYSRAVRARKSRGMSEPISQPIWFGIGHSCDDLIDDDSRRRLLVATQFDHPTNFTLLMMLGLLEFDSSVRKTDPVAKERCIRWYRAALAVRPQSVTAWNHMGSALETAGDLPAAIAAFRASARIKPADALTRYLLGHALAASGNRAGAISAYREAVRLKPDFYNAHNNLGHQLMQSGKLTEAVAAFKESLRANPRHHPAQYNLGLALMEAKDIDGALAAFQASVQLQPNHGPSHTSLGACYLMKKQYLDASRCAKEAIRCDSKNDSAYALLGHASWPRGDFTSARAAYTEAARLDKTWKRYLDSLPPPPLAPAPREVKRP